MTKVLTWDKPRRKMSVEQWKGISADGAPPGVYTPNMSDKDAAKWRAKLIKGGADPRVEIRKTCEWDNGKRTWPREEYLGYYAQLSITVRRSANDHGPQVRISANGTVAMSHNDALDMNMAIQEAIEALCCD